MAQASPEIPEQTYNPPRLPDYLKKVHELKPIVGAPSDEEINAIHAVIRAANTIAQIPGMFDPQLSMNLTQHLFNVQMARYQENYPCIFRRTTVYTPPPLPAHVPVTLEPIVGAPSDEEIQQAHTAARTYDQYCNIPAMFDPSVSMQLSQHLFNIQLARYMQLAVLGFGVTKSAPDPNDQESTKVSGATHPARELIDRAEED